MAEKLIDLHVHTNYSDGFDDIATVIRKARANNVKVISITEHYNISSLRLAKRYAKGHIEVIPGIEIGADMSEYEEGKGRKHVCHILGYFVSDSICLLLDSYETHRRECVKKTLELLREQNIKLSISNVEFVARDKNSIGRYDIALALSYYGYVCNPQEAYGKYLNYHCSGFVRRKKLGPEQLVRAIINFGGVPVLAHPKSLRLRSNSELEFMKKLADAGLKGIEVYNPNNTYEQRQHYLKLCELYNLIPTVGSDYHGGDRKPEILIGLGINNNLCISDMEIVERIKSVKS